MRVVDNDFIDRVSINEPLAGQYMSVADSHVYARLHGIGQHFSSTDSGAATSPCRATASTADTRGRDAE